MGSKVAQTPTIPFGWRRRTALVLEFSEEDAWTSETGVGFPGARRCRDGHRAVGDGCRTGQRRIDSATHRARCGIELGPVALASRCAPRVQPALVFRKFIASMQRSVPRARSGEHRVSARLPGYVFGLPLAQR
jgi:hypothetical protein